MYELEKNELIAAGLEMERLLLIALSGGNLSCRPSKDHVVVTPSGMSYGDIGPDDMVVQGARRPPVDTPALWRAPGV